MSHNRTTGLNRLGPSPRALRELNKGEPGYTVHTSGSNKYRAFNKRQTSKRITEWLKAHPQTPEQIAAFHERGRQVYKRRIVRMAVGDALASGHAVTTHHVRKITLPKLKFQEIEP
jgi:hypothetical protein